MTQARTFGGAGQSGVNPKSALIGALHEDGVDVRFVPAEESSLWLSILSQWLPVIFLFLVFTFFVSRFILFITAWAATAKENEQEDPVPVPGPVVIRSEVTVHSGPSGGTAAGLLGAGLLTGLLGGRLLSGRRR